MEKWARAVGDNPTFEEALLDWIVMDSQAFTVVEGDNFKRMIRATGFSGKLISTNTVANRLQDQAKDVDRKLIELLERTCSTFSMSIDAWKSNNEISFLAFNANWASPNFKIYRALLEFILIDCSHTGENLALIIFNRLKKLGALTKLLAFTADNAQNNDTCV